MRSIFQEKVFRANEYGAWKEWQNRTWWKVTESLFTGIMTFIIISVVAYILIGK